MSMIASAPGGEICVCDLTPAFTLSGPTISHHLKTLREAGLVAAERRGTWVYYRPQRAVLRQLAALLTVEAAPAVQVDGGGCAFSHAAARRADARDSQASWISSASSCGSAHRCGWPAAAPTGGRRSARW